jgi:hypothetical protein
MIQKANASVSHHSHENLYLPEELYSGWISNSLVLMTSSLLFYHMTMVKSLEMHPRLAGFFAVILILISVAYATSSIIPYYQRTDRFIKNHGDNPVYEEQIVKEKSNKILYLVLGAILCTVQLGIAYVIVRGSIRFNQSS